MKESPDIPQSLFETAVYVCRTKKTKKGVSDKRACAVDLTKRLKKGQLNKLLYNLLKHSAKAHLH